MNMKQIHIAIELNIELVVVEVVVVVADVVEVVVETVVLTVPEAMEMKVDCRRMLDVIVLQSTNTQRGSIHSKF